MNDSFSDLIDPGELVQLPIERAETIPSDWYTNPEFLSLENQAIFTKEWQFACHISQLPEPGSFIRRTIAGNPVIILRTNKQEIRAFYNVCKHRGGPLAVKKGTTTVLQCRYHGWTYRTDGSLRGVPQFEYTELFEKKDFGLKPVQTETWNGLVFITLNENPTPLQKAVKGIEEKISPINLADMRYYATTTDLVECNWKVYADNYLEGYHIPIVHPELAGLLDYRNYVTEIDDYYSLQHSPFKSKVADKPRMPDSLSGPQIRTVKSKGMDTLYNTKDGRAYYYFIFPNIMLNILPGRLQTNIIEPVGHDKCRVIFDFFYSNIDDAVKNGTAAGDLEASASIQKEDIEICEQVQKGLHSSAYHKGRFSVKRELGVWHFQKLVKERFYAYLKNIL